MHLRTSDDFAHWFTSLDQATAEDVATTLEVIIQLGPEREAPGSTEWVTWYEHPSLSSRLRDLHPHSFASPAFLRCVHEWGVFIGYTRRVVKHLESKSFVARVGQLSATEAAVVSDAVARIKKTVTQRQLLSMELYRRRALKSETLPPKEARDLAPLIDGQDIRDAYLCALAAAGFTVVDVPAHSPALREIALRTPAPGFRLLYGIDVPRNRGLVVVGEHLDRSFYGDSVRRGERQWQEFLEGAEGTTRPLPAR